MSDKREKQDVIARVAALPAEDQRNLAFFVAGMVAKSGSEKTETEQKNSDEN